MEIVTYTLRFAARSFAQLGTPHGIVMALASVVGYFLPEAYLQDCAIAAIGLIVFDALTAVAAAYLTGEAISSAKAGRTLSKFVIYFCLVGAISLAFKTVPELVQVRPRAVQVILIWVILRETISIIENADKANIRIPKALRNIVRDASKRTLMKSTLILTAIATASLASAQDFDLAVVVGKRGVEPAVARRIGTLSHAFNTRWNIDVSAFAGSKLEGGALFGGFSLSVPLKLSDGIDFCPGVYARFVQSRPVQGGLFFGFRVR